MAGNSFSSLGEIISNCIEQKFPFALYRLPGEQQIHCIAHKSPTVVLEQGFPFPSAPGFVFYPFQPDKNTPTYFVGADYHFRCLYKDITPEEILRDYRFEPAEAENIETTEATHLQKVQEAIDTIKNGRLTKVILSRVQSYEGIERSPVSTFIELCGKYDNAFISLVYIPGKVLWLTVSPELLVSSNKGEIKTAAVAGTIAPKGIWTEKEINEQKLVTHYIKNVLEKYCTEVDLIGPVELNTGNVIHLRTTFTAQLDSGLWDLVMDLHPTPAVCGVPKEEAKKFIMETELHKRKYYSGFLGPCNLDGETSLFVNLRCAELSNNKTHLYVGGGITAESNPKAEWDETVMKTKTLLSVLKPVPAEKAV